MSEWTLNHELHLPPVRVIDGHVPLVVGSCVADGNGMLLLGHFWKMQALLSRNPGLKNGFTPTNKNDLAFVVALKAHVIYHLGMIAEDTGDGFVVHDVPKLALGNL